jgi:hypothetical protein
MSHVDTNPRLKLHADIAKLAREKGVINDIGTELRKRYWEGENPTVKEELEIKLKTLERLVGGDEVAALRTRAGELYQLPAVINARS